MIKIKGLVKHFGNFTVLDHLDLHVKKGTIYGLVGVNGSGKTTIIKHITGVYKEDFGTVFVDGDPVYDCNDLKQKIGYVSDDVFYFGQYSLDRLQKFYRNLYKNWSNDRYFALVERFQLSTKKSLKEFSKGMQKQASIILELSTMPELLILDEPIDGLDPIVRRLVLEEIMVDVAERGMTVLISSHNLKEMEGICDTVGIVRNGKMFIERDLDDLKSDIHKIQVAFSHEMLDPVQNNESICVLHKEQRGSVLLYVIRGKEQSVIDELNQYNPILLDFLPLSLEEIFIYEMEGDLDATNH